MDFQTFRRIGPEGEGSIEGRIKDRAEVFDEGDGHLSVILDCWFSYRAYSPVS